MYIGGSPNWMQYHGCQRLYHSWPFSDTYSNFNHLTLYELLPERVAAVSWETSFPRQDTGGGEVVAELLTGAAFPEGAKIVHVPSGDGETCSAVPHAVLSLATLHVAALFRHDPGGDPRPRVVGHLWTELNIFVRIQDPRRYGPSTHAQDEHTHGCLHERKASLVMSH